ncbi:MAG: esterase-like activity of phytase family protein [Sphingomonadales bacterium]|nr:esterase-like activity of phytase family protein [Sphingomonadales bacterium]
MLRRLLALIVAMVMIASIWLRSDVPQPSALAGLTVVAIPLEQGCCQTGPLTLLGAWQLSSRHGAFGGYSALLQNGAGRLLAISDRGYFLDFSEPGSGVRPPQFGAINQDSPQNKADRDFEAATRDPATGKLWLAQEGRNVIQRHGRGMAREAFRAVPEMKGWSRNSGPEAMLRLADGRFLVVCECTGPGLLTDLHPGLIFGSDPALPGTAQQFSFAGVAGYRPTDMAQLPDGRILILARRLLWPLPPRFAMKVLVADPAELRAGGTWHAREVADIDAPWPVDNYEGLAIEPMVDGTLIAWMISDENRAATQRVLLLKVRIDPARL